MAVQFPVLSPGLLGLGLGLGPVDTRPSASSVTGLKLQITVEAKSTAEGALGRVHGLLGGGDQPLGHLYREARKPPQGDHWSRSMVFT